MLGYSKRKPGPPVTFSDVSPACSLYLHDSLPSCFAKRLLNSLGLTASSHSRLQFK